ncbi:MAG: hypothetical protein LBE83_02240 [Propionibacteriaceae bacterium]|nr:hypothetical protein [Propionibacteriaceae bacterium]
MSSDNRRGKKTARKKRARAIQEAADLEQARYQFHLHNATGLLNELAREDVPDELRPSLRAQAQQEANRLRQEALIPKIKLAGAKTVTLEETLVKAVEHFTHLPLEVRTTLGREVDLGIEEAEVLANAVVTLLYNVQFHAQATEVVVNADCDKQGWEASVSDNGVGFDPTNTRYRFGLKTQVLELPKSQGMTVEITSAPGEGTCVVIRGKRQRPRSKKKPALLVAAGLAALVVGGVLIWHPWNLIPEGAPDPPLAPTWTRLEPVDGKSRVEVCWSEPDDKGATISSYTLRPSTGTSITVAPVGAKVCQPIELSVSTTDYTFKVAAVNEVGQGGFSSPSLGFRAAIPPGEVSGLMATEGEKSCQVQFTGAALNGAKPSEISYHWSAGTVSGQFGQSTSGSVGPLVDSGEVQVITVWAATTVQGVTQQGPSETVTCNPYGRPGNPEATATSTATPTTTATSMATASQKPTTQDEKPRPLEGKLEAVEGNTVTGWAWDPGNPSGAVTVRIRIFNSNGDEVTVTPIITTTNIYRSEIKNGGNYGFRATIDWWYYVPGQNYKVVAYAMKGSTGEPLTDSKTFFVQPIFGNFDHADETKIQAWAWKPDAPNESLTIEIRIYDASNTEVDRFSRLANVNRPDLPKHGFGTGRYGLDVIYDWSKLPPGVYHAVAYATDGSGTTQKLLNSTTPHTNN